MNYDAHNLDSEIAALAQGRLPATALGRVRRQLTRESRQIKRDIRVLLQRYGNDMPLIEPAPALLRNRLRAIPGPASSNVVTPLRLSLSATLAAAVIVLLVVFHRPPQDSIPTQAEVEQARAELAITFSYMQRISNRSEYYMRREIGHTMQDALIDGIFLGLKNNPKKG